MNYKHIYIIGFKENRLVFIEKKEDEPIYLYSGLTNRVDELNNRLDREIDLKKRDEIKEKIKECKDKLKEFSRPIRSDTEFDQAVKEWSSDNTTLEKLEDKTLSLLEFSYLIDSDISFFFDKKTQKEIEDAKEAMQRTDRLTDTLDPITYDKNVIEAENKWSAFKIKAINQIEEYRKRNINIAFEITISKDPDRISSLKREKQNNKEIIKKIEAQLKTDGKLEWIKSQSGKIEKEKLLNRDKRNKVPDEAIEKAKSFITQSEVMRKQAILAYLEEKAKKLLNAVKENPTVFGTEKDKNNETQAETISRWLESGIIRSLKERPDKWEQKNISQLNRNLNETNRHILSDTKNALDLQKNRPEYEEKIKKDYAEYTQLRQAFTKERCAKLIQAIDSSDNPSGKAIRSFLIELNEPNSRTSKNIQEWDKQIENIQQLSPEEFIQVKNDLATVLKKFRGLDNIGTKIDETLNIEKLDEGKQAFALRKELEKANNPAELHASLKQSPLADKIEYVSNNRFKNYPDPAKPGKTIDLQKYTGGNMVFYKRDDKWGIIINKETLKDEKEFKSAKDRITHELLHVEFEKNKEVNQKWIIAYTASHAWTDIKQKFASAFPKKKPPAFQGEKKEYTAEDWQDHDVVSELFAMQNDIGETIRSGDKSRFNDLRTAILEAGIPQAAIGMKEPKMEIYGAEAEDTAEKDIINKLQKEQEASGSSEKEPSDTKESSADMMDKALGLQTQIENYLKSIYIGYLPGGKNILKTIKDFNADTIGWIDEYKKSDSGALGMIIPERLSMIEKDLADIQKELETISAEVPNLAMSPWRNLWNNTAFISLDDILQFGKDFKEWWVRRHNRKRADNAAKIGMTLFKDLNIPIIGEYGDEASARQEKAQADEVEEWKSRLSNKDAWQIIEIMEHMAVEIIPNADKLKAILRILSEKGRINWRNTKLWEILNKLQNATYLSPEDPLMKDPIVLSQKLRIALGEIFDYDEYQSLERTNESSYESEKGKHMGPLDAIQTKISGRLEQLYKKHLLNFRDGDDNVKIDPMEFEALLEYSIKNGKSEPEFVMFYLLAGMATGLLTPNRGYVLNKYLNEWPSIEYITHKSNIVTREGYEKLCREKFGKEFLNGDIPKAGGQYMNFYWTEVQNAPTVVGRARKAVPQRKWDHDWSRTIACLGDTEAVKVVLSGRAGMSETMPTMVENYYVGLLQWFEENATNPHENWREQFGRHIAQFIMSEGILNDFAFRNERGFFRDTSIYSNAPREAGMAYHGGWNLKQHCDHMRSFISGVPGVSEFLSLVTSNDIYNEDPQKRGEAPDHTKKIVQFLSQYPTLSSILPKLTTINDVYKHTEIIVKAILNTIPDNIMISRIKTMVPK